MGRRYFGTRFLFHKIQREDSKSENIGNPICASRWQLLYDSNLEKKICNEDFFVKTLEEAAKPPKDTPNYYVSLYSGVSLSNSSLYNSNSL